MREHKKGLMKSENIYHNILSRIENKELHLNSPLPSIAQLSKEFGVANETVFKAYKRLKEKGIITSIPQKGFYVSKVDIAHIHNIFVFFDTFSSYKEVLYNAMLERFDGKVILDMYFHHYNLRLFQTLIRESIGKYDYYIILPFYVNGVKEALKLIPEDKLFMVDCQLEDFTCKGVYQHFESDVFKTLVSLKHRLSKYKRIQFVYKGNFTPVLKMIYKGLTEACSQISIDLTKNNGSSCPEIERENAYLVVDDEHLVELIINGNSKKYMPGSDYGIISYNETSLKKIAAGGISVITTDFKKMGTEIAEMVLKKKTDINQNPCLFIDRGSF